MSGRYTLLMHPYLNLGPLHLGTFGLFLWLAAVGGGFLLHRNFLRNGVTADALNIVCLVTLAGVLGAKTWHELQNPAELASALHAIAAPGFAHFGQVLLRLGEWMRSGIAWFGGLLAGITTLVLLGVRSRPNGLGGWRAGLRMLDLAAPAVPLGYGIGRIGCMTSGDGDYGRETTSAWGVHLSPDALVPTLHPGALVLPTPFWEFGIGVLIAAILWRLGARARHLGWLTGLYLLLSGVARFLVEFYRVNPKLYLNHTLSNAQVAALGTIFLGTVVVVLSRSLARVSTPTGDPTHQAA